MSIQINVDTLATNETIRSAPVAWTETTPVDEERTVVDNLRLFRIPAGITLYPNPFKDRERGEWLMNSGKALLLIREHAGWFAVMGVLHPDHLRSATPKGVDITSLPISMLGEDVLKVLAQGSLLV